jgi:hypothetical protein
MSNGLKFEGINMVPAPAIDRLRIQPQLALTFVLSFVAPP